MPNKHGECLQEQEIWFAKVTQFKERVRNLLEVSLDQVLIYLPALGTSVIVFNRRLNEKNGKNSNN